jgi:hypothetical protein
MHTFNLLSSINHPISSTMLRSTAHKSEISPIVSPGTTDPETLLAFPNTNPDSTDLICGRNASIGWAQTKTATVNAGDSVGALCPILPLITLSGYLTPLQASLSGEAYRMIRRTCIIPVSRQHGSAKSKTGTWPRIKATVRPLFLHLPYA